MALNDKQQRFVDEYLKDLNATQAAIRAGYSAKTAYAIAEKLLRKVEIQQAVQDAKQARSKRTEITQDRVLQSLHALLSLTLARCSMVTAARRRSASLTTTRPQQ